LNIENTFEYNGRTYGIRHDKLGQLDIWVYAPGNSGSHRAWQRVHKFKSKTDLDGMERAINWVEENIHS
jgi:hypothetical protein